MPDVSCLPSRNLVKVLQPHQYVRRLAAVGGSQDPRQLELVDDPRRTPVADAHAPLQQRGRPQLILNADLGGLPEQRVALARLPPPLPAGFAGFRPFYRPTLGLDLGLRLFDR